MCMCFERGNTIKNAFTASAYPFLRLVSECEKRERERKREKKRVRKREKAAFHIVLIMQIKLVACYWCDCSLQ